MLCSSVAPHPDAVADGTCSAPPGWTPPPDREPDVSASTSDAEPTEPTAPSAAVPSDDGQVVHDPPAPADELPVTGAGFEWAVGTAFALLIVGAVMILAGVARVKRMRHIPR